MIITNAIITAYCACKICCGPDATGITAAGIKPRPNVTIAAPRNIPLGTKVTVNNRIYTVQDRTARRFDGRWDIYMSSHKVAKKFGKQRGTIKIHN